jgi:hypothetical protein
MQLLALEHIPQVVAVALVKQAATQAKLVQEIPVVIVQQVAKVVTELQLVLQDTVNITVAAVAAQVTILRVDMLVL